MILIVIPAAVLAVASLAAFAGRWVWWLDVLANFRAQYAVVLTVLGLVVLASARWRWAGYGVLAAAVVNLITVLPLYVASPGTPTSGVPTVRVVSFNVLSDNESFAEVIEYLRRVDADLVLLHEISRPWEIAIESSELGYEVIRPRADHLIFGTLVLIRGEVTRAVSHGFAEAQPRAVEVTFVPDGWPEEVSVLATHPLAPSTERRARLRDSQVLFAAEWAAEQEGGYLVVGDFNATPWSWSIRHMLSTTELRNSQLGFGLQPSFPTTSWLILRVPIDHLFHSPGLAVRDRQTGPSLGSDHVPLIVDLELVP